MTTTLERFARGYVEELATVLDTLKSAEFQLHLQSALGAIMACRNAGGTVWLVGNGGSAALASHMATDLQLAGVRAIALTDVAAVTTYGNDYAYENIFLIQLNALAKPGDVLIGISGSGNSDNVTAAILRAQSCRIVTIGVVGFDGGAINKYCKPDILLHFPSVHMGRSQDGHQVILHILCYYLMQEKGR